MGRDDNSYLLANLPLSERRIACYGYAYIEKLLARPSMRGASI